LDSLLDVAPQISICKLFVASDLSQEPTGKISAVFRNASRLAVILWLDISVMKGLSSSTSTLAACA
jgi:hypothetical protein